MDDASPELMDISLEVTVTTPDPPDKTRPMFDAWRERCPIYLALFRPRAVTLTMQVA